ncbi:uncharacterized protein LOC8059923 [Sorghum bicolor]|uniref:DUF4220 domain-containing protein n=1 Tax=Sorghum bicolor TaxID=4558 RepID=A0A1W0W1X4_SORBI|nr:uncharacterized protein LOC8059923 [Sorghum bicolor]OQU88398.1 hypothetical protein SORBI_3002G025500 [Sorghum bicolor]|eukprot:XP_002461418.1 uncharacterized protein LOC8059923 [Sorghum bicolor]
MDYGGNCTATATLHEQVQCSSDAIKTFSNTRTRQIWLGNALLFASPGVIGVLVGIGGYGQRYRHHPSIRFIFLGANTLFLPIVSSVVSSLSDSSNDYVNSPNNKCTGSTLAALCYSNIHPCTVITWAFLVQIASINTTSVVATDTRESPRIGPSLELLVKGIWILYLGASITGNRFFYGIFGVSHGKNHMSSVSTSICSKIMFAPFVLICAKLWLKCYAFKKARSSFALGRNPGLVFGYMQQLQQQERIPHGEPLIGEDAGPPPLLVMGEDRRQVVNHPCGYVFTNGSGDNNNGLVTLDKIWQSDKALLMVPKLKDLCLSYALFKLLRCRFARYKISDVDSVRMLAFFRSLLLMEGGHDRVFRVIADELCFVHDYYYSSSSISYAKCWVPILNTFISLLSIVYCIVAASFILALAVSAQHQKGHLTQIQCHFWCTQLLAASRRRSQNFGSLYVDLVAVFLLLALVLSTEVRDIASYICSNWTKVALTYHHVNCTSSQHPLGIQNWVVSRLLKCRSMTVNQWEETIGQCSVLALDHPIPSPTVRLINFFRLPDEMIKVKVPEAVKVCILDVLRSICNNSHGLHRLSNGASSLRRIQDGDRFIWACNGNGTADIILTWHIATCILEARHPYRHDLVKGSPFVSDQHKVAATHLSRYCAYLMTWFPEILPDEIEWSKSLYEVVKENATRVIAVRAATWLQLAPEAKYLELVQLLSEGSNHEVLQNGVRLGKQLVEEFTEAEEIAWAMVADFWAEMILYVASLKNLRGHSNTIARGGELITLLWALLFHAGIVSRPGETGTAASV